MTEFFSKLLSTSDFPARWHCGNWSTAHGVTHIVSDFAIAGAYATIPILLAFFVLRRRDVPFPPVFWLFGAFILFCGLGHLIEGVIFWYPWYRLSAVVKACTAIVSWLTVVALLPTLPKALALPSLAVVNERLATEVSERKKEQAKLQGLHGEMERFTESTLDREDRVIELKQEVNALLVEMGRASRYTIEPVNG